jgi:predicted nucleotidyltransferase/DNA-binding transcriptional ArsR family regulator
MNLADLLFGSYRRDVLGLLLLHPGESYHVREIARITGKPANTLYRELGTLARSGLLIRRAQGNQVHYEANTANPIYEELRGILKKTTGVVDVFRFALEPLAKRIKLALIYGSVASGKESAWSDIDLLLVGDVKFEEVVNVLGPAEDALRREDNRHVYGEREFAEKGRRKELFLARVLEGPKLMLSGDIRDIGKPGRNRKAKAA